jgi:hypothetical protein
MAAPAMSIRTQITLDPEIQRRATTKARELGISFAEYVRRAVVQDLGGSARKTHVSMLFDLVDEGPATDIARDKDAMLAEALLHEHRRKVAKRRSKQSR